jgi:hypothetical protein
MERAAVNNDVCITIGVDDRLRVGANTFKQSNLKND